MTDAALATLNRPAETAAALPEARDPYGNLIMSLKDIGLDGTIRYHRFEDGVKFSMIDVVKVVTGKDNNESGNFIIKLVFSYF